MTIGTRKSDTDILFEALANAARVAGYTVVEHSGLQWPYKAGLVSIYRCYAGYCTSPRHFACRDDFSGFILDECPDIDKLAQSAARLKRGSLDFAL